MIVSSAQSPKGAKATIINSGKGTIAGSAYQGFKHVARVYGFYKDIQPYLPETHITRGKKAVHDYVYYKQKRGIDYAFPSRLSKKKTKSSSCQFNEKQCIS